MSTGILGWFFGKGPNKAFNKGVEKVAMYGRYKEGKPKRDILQG